MDSSRLLTSERETAEVPGDADGEVENGAPCGTCSFRGGVANVAVTAVGAGLLAMPKAYASVGLLAGVGLTAVICVLTFISGSVIISLCADGRRPSYGALVRAEFGPTAGRWLQTSILVHVFGVMVVYLVIIADMLVGSAPDWHGLLPYLLSRHDGPWFLRRWAVTGGLVLTVVCPMLAARDLSVVSRFSRFSVALMLALAATLFGLAGVAVAGGQAGDVHVLPPPLAGGPLAHLSAALTVLAVLALAFTNQMNLVPIHNSLADGSTRNMLSVTRHAIALCALLYGALAVAGYTLFGSATEGDVLKNLTVRHVSTLVGRRPAEALVSFIVAANTANLLVNFVLKTWAVRESVTELVLERPAATLAPAQWGALTAGLVGATYGVSVVVPSVWFVVSLVGSTACVTFAYAFPGMLLLKKSESAPWRAAGAGGVGLAALMAGVAVWNALSGNAGL